MKGLSPGSGNGLRTSPSLGGQFMALVHANFFSPSLQKEVGLNALLPDRQDKRGPYPVLYLLHGLSDDYTAWVRWTSIERYVRETPLIVVMPDGDRSFYCDLAEGAQYEQAIQHTDADHSSEFPEGAQLCKKCNTKAMIQMDGCMTCLNCGESKCS